MYGESIIQTTKWATKKSLLVATVLNLGIVLLSTISFGQVWSGILNPTRAINWNGTGFTIPNYSVPCATQPTLLAGSGQAAANTTAIQNALASCDSTHNVVNLPAGTYYVAGLKYGTQGKQVLRGAGASTTYLYFTGPIGGNCGSVNLCMANQFPGDASSTSSLPGPNGSEQCAWTAGYAQGTTSITLNNCGGNTPGPPPLNQMMILDQANDASDNSGAYLCDTTQALCTLKGQGSGNLSGRLINGVGYSQQQNVLVTGVSGSGAGPYTVTIFPGVYFNNVRTGQNPGAWWNGFVQNDGLESLTVDYSLSTSNAYGLAMWNCYQCWVKNVRSMWGKRDHILVQQSMASVIRDSYFYQSQSHATVSYAIEPIGSSAILIENNIFQQVTSPYVSNQASGFVLGYNFGTDNTVNGSYMQGSYAGHNGGSGMNLFEGNSFNGLFIDATWGSSNLGTYFRNMLPGWQSGFTNQTVSIDLDSYMRGYSVVGNVMGQPGYHTHYESYATSASGGVNGGAASSLSIYMLGWTNNGGLGNCTSPPVCDPLARSTLMRWGNYDTVNAAVRWDTAEAAPGAVPYINANFTPSYFSTLAQTLPPSLYLSGKPSWWRSMPFPAIGPDISTGTLGICTGAYAGAMVSSSSQCSGGGLSSAWANHAYAIPAQDCFLNVMGGRPDGTGGALNFDANACYTSQGGGPQAPQNLGNVVH